MYSFDDLTAYVNGINYDYNQVSESNIILFGAGFFFHMIKEKLDSYGFNIVYGADNDNDKWGTTLDGLRIVSPEEIKKIKNPYVIITSTSRHYASIRQQLNDMHINNISYDDFAVKLIFQKICHVYDTLSDTTSKDVYVNAIMHNLRSEGFEDIYTPEQYFCIPEFRDLSVKRHTFVDCGAHVGINSEKFVNYCEGNFNKIYAFEPTKRSCEGLIKRMNRVMDEYGLDRNKCIVENSFVGRSDCLMGLKEYDTTANYMTTASESNVSIPCWSLDSYFQKMGGIPTFIKADIEGSEKELIDGGRNIIATNKPMLALCVYHIFDDIVDIPLKIIDINPDYKISIRHHMSIESETVLYAY